MTKVPTVELSIEPWDGDDGDLTKLRQMIAWDIDDIALGGRFVIVRNPRGSFGPYRSDELVDPTWGDIERCANEQVAATGDHHHLFLEGIERGDTPDDWAAELTLILGS